MWVKKKYAVFCSFRKAKRVDIVSRVLFPGSYVLFVMIYWIYYLGKSDYYTVYRNRPILP